MTSQATLAEKIERLPPELRDRLGAFVDELMTLVPEKEPSRKRPRLGWAAGLSAARDTCTSVELQHRALEWAAVTFLFDMNVLLELLFDREQAGQWRIP